MGEFDKHVILVEHPMYVAVCPKCFWESDANELFSFAENDLAIHWEDEHDDTEYEEDA